MHESSAAKLTAAACACACLMGVPGTARSDWGFGADAHWRYDSNVGNAQLASDIAGDASVAAKLSASQFFPVAHGFAVTLAADLSGEDYDRLHGLTNAAVGGTLGLRKKWGVGAYAPWARIGLSAVRTATNDDYRSASVFRGVLGGGRRIGERWSFSAGYAFEQRNADPQPEEVPGISGDAFSESSHTLDANAQYAWTQNIYLTARGIVRHGGVISTTQGSLSILKASRAVAEDPTFGPEAYAYRLTGTTYGVRVGIDVAAGPHHLIGVDFARFETHADGGIIYTKSIPEISWNYNF